jgi:hypothetical protein
MNVQPPFSAEKIKGIIEYHNEELPKVLKANPNDLILGDNEISRTVRGHLGTLVAIVGYGTYGSGKTWTCYKIIHDLKNEALVTYVPLRAYREKGRKKLTLNSYGVSSLVATAIAEALVRPLSLANEVDGVLTNIPTDIQSININKKLEEVLETYTSILRSKQTYHIVLLDEFDAGLESVHDIEALVDFIVASRRLFEKYGTVRITLVALMAPVPSEALGEENKNRPIYVVFRERLESRAPRVIRGPYEALTILDRDLNEIHNVISMLRDYVLKSVEIVRREINIRSINIYNIDKAVEVLARIWPSMRWGKDILKKAVAKAIAEAIASGQQADLLDYVYRSLEDTLRLYSPNNVENILIKGKWSYIRNYSLNKVRKFVERLLEGACKIIPDCYAEYYGESMEPGFISLLGRVIGKVKGKGEKVCNIAFWLRLSDVTEDRTVAKAKKVFRDHFTIMIVPDNIRIKLVPDIVLRVLRLPSPLVYYMLTTADIDAAFQQYCEDLLDEMLRKYSAELGILLKSRVFS